MNFRKFYISLIKEAKFRNSKHISHIADYPMFSVFVTKDILQDSKTIAEVKQWKQILPDILEKAKKYIGAMGFPSMHANIVIKDLTGEINHNNGLGIGAQADPSRRYMDVNVKGIKKGEKWITETIVHEWAHLYMLSRGNAFAKVIKQLFNELKNISYRDTNKNLDVTKVYDSIKDTISPSFITRKEDLFYKEILRIKDIYLKYNANGSDDYYKVNYERLFKIYSSEIEIFLYHCLEELNVNPNNNTQDIKKVSEQILSLVFRKLDKLKLSGDYSHIKTDQEWNNELWNNNEFKPIALNFRRIIYNFYSQKHFKYENLEGADNEYFRKTLAELINWPSSYGMSNEDEFWATALQYFFKLPMKYRKMIVDTLNK